MWVKLDRKMMVLNRFEKRGFALPTVLIASFVMLLILTTTLSSVSSGIVTSLDSARYDRYAKIASQSGLAMARACLKANNYEPTWTNSSPLRPNTSCSGAVVSGVSQFIHEEDAFRSSFYVPAPTTLANGVQRVTVSSSTERMRTSTDSAWRIYSESMYATISAQNSFDSVTFGYAAQGTSVFGAFFGVVDSLGKVSAVGYNGNGQLGNGTLTNAATPREFILPAGQVASKLYSSFLSQGFNMFAVTEDGSVYGAGSNASGQLGNGSMSTTQSTPVKFNLPAGVQARYIASAFGFTHIIGSDNNVYSAGVCNEGQLGYNYSISGCTNQSTYKRVALPAVNTSDLNTLPVTTSDGAQSTNLTSDSNSTYLRMQGGRVYGWGSNLTGQLGDGTTTNRSSPVKVGTWGDSGKPKATQIGTDGISLWVLDSLGDVYATGNNLYGQLGAATSLSTPTGTMCIDDPGYSMTDGQQMQIYSCNDTNSQLLEWRTDGSLIVRPLGTTEKCITNYNGITTDANPVIIQTCNSSSAQKWVYRDDNTIYNAASGKCLNNPGNTSTSGTLLRILTCSTSASMKWTLRPALSPRKVSVPPAGKVLKISVDQWMIQYLMEDGTVWSSGLNTAGQMGIGSVNKYNPALKKTALPVGRSAVDIYTTKNGPDTDTNYANSYFILDDGSVWGTGSNTFGQIGNGSTWPYISTPQKMNLPAGTRAQSVQTGAGTTVVLTDEGKIYTIGNNSNGQLGDGTTTSSSTPIARQYINTRPLLLY